MLGVGGLSRFCKGQYTVRSSQPNYKTVLFSKRLSAGVGPRSAVGAHRIHTLCFFRSRPRSCLAHPHLLAARLQGDVSELKGSKVPVATKYN